MFILFLLKKLLVLLGIIKPRVLIFDSYPEPEWWWGKIREKMEKKFEVNFVNPNFPLEKIYQLKLYDVIILDIGLDMDVIKLYQELHNIKIKNSKFLFWTIYYSKNVIKYISDTCNKIKSRRIIEKISPSNSEFNVSKFFRLLKSMV